LDELRQQNADFLIKPIEQRVKENLADAQPVAPVQHHEYSDDEGECCHLKAPDR